MDGMQEIVLLNAWFGDARSILYIHYRITVMIQ